MNVFFRKENMLNTIFFSALLIMVIAKTILNSESLKEITFIISILLLVWSIINIVVSVMEEINDDLTENIKCIEGYIDYSSLSETFAERHMNGNVFYLIQNSTKEDIKKINFSDSEVKNDVREYWQFANKRKFIRKLRKIFIFLSCIDLILMISYLFLANDINKYLPISNYDLTIWTLLLVFFEFMIKRPLTNSIISVIIKKIKTIKILE